MTKGTKVQTPEGVIGAVLDYNAETGAILVDLDGPKGWYPPGMLTLVDAGSEAPGLPPPSLEEEER